MQLKDSQQFPVAVAATDKKGHAAPFENPQFTVSPAELGTFEVDPSDPAKGTFKAGAPGDGSLDFTADGQTGEGEAPFAASLPITVLPGNAVVGQISAGAVGEQEG